MRRLGEVVGGLGPGIAFPRFVSRGAAADRGASRVRGRVVHARVGFHRGFRGRGGGGGGGGRFGKGAFRLVLGQTRRGGALLAQERTEERKRHLESWEMAIGGCLWLRGVVMVGCQQHGGYTGEESAAVGVMSKEEARHRDVYCVLCTVYDGRPGHGRPKEGGQAFDERL